jgi:hypothetical protein
MHASASTPLCACGDVLRVSLAIRLRRSRLQRECRIGSCLGYVLYVSRQCGGQHSIMWRVERSPDQQGRTVRCLRITRRKSSKPAAQYSHGALVARMRPLQFVYECLSARRAADLAQHAVKDNVLFLLGQLGCEIGHSRFKIARGHMPSANNVSNGKVILQNMFPQ